MPKPTDSDQRDRRVKVDTPHAKAESDPPGAKMISVSPDDLLFDAENPRFGGQLVGKSQPEIQRAILGPPHYASELVDSLLENGFIPYEPLVVRQQGDKYVVVEGNRRLAAVREIRANFDKHPNRKSDLDLIPVLSFPQQMTPDLVRNDLRIYLGIRHLLGFREWPPLSKAEFLDREIKKQGGLDQVIKEIRLTKQQVRRFLVPYRLLKAANIQLPSGEDFWVLGEALNRAGVKKFVQLDVNPDNLEINSYNKANFKLVLDDLYGPREASHKQRDVNARKVYDTRDLSTYAKALSSEKAASVLHAGKSLGEAAIYVDTREESLKRLSKLVREMGLLLRKLTSQQRGPAAVQVQEAYKEFDSAVRAFLKKNA